MAKRKVTKKSTKIIKKNKGWGGFTPFQIIVMGAVLVVFVIFFLV
jgi:hypothetical protein